MGNWSYNPTYSPTAECFAYTPLKTNMNSWKFPMFNREYIFIHGGFPATHVSFRGGNSYPPTKNL